jgi:hypothetical protein
LGRRRRTRSHPDEEIAMNSNSYLNTAITAHLIDARIDDARTRTRVVVARRRASRRRAAPGAGEDTSPSRRQWFSRPATA